VRTGITFSVVILALSLSSTASAQLAVSADDGKQLRPGETADSRTPDMISVIDMDQSPPRLISTLEVPTSMIGPPTSIALAPDESFALVAAAQALEGENIVKNDTVSVIDLNDPSNPSIVQTLSAGAGATGVAINRAGDLALVAGTGSDAIAIFSITDGRLTPAGQVRLDYQTRPTDVAFTPDGRTALAVAQSGNEIIVLSVNGAEVTRTGERIAPGLSPYGAAVSPDGRFAFNTNLRGEIPPGGPVAGSSGIGTISVIDLSDGSVSASVEVGVTPEHVALSPDGAYAAVVLLNGSNASEEAPHYNPFGLLKIFSIDGATLALAGEARTGKWCQGVAWSDDNRRLLLQCAMDREIEVYDFDGAALTRDAGATVSLISRPGAIATASSR
jgi:DNA-binding beta-propeller fold protein YncE